MAYTLPFTARHEAKKIARKEGIPYEKALSLLSLTRCKGTAAAHQADFLLIGAGMAIPVTPLNWATREAALHLDDTPALSVGGADSCVLVVTGSDYAVPSLPTLGDDTTVLRVPAPCSDGVTGAERERWPHTLLSILDATHQQDPGTIVITWPSSAAALLYSFPEAEYQPVLARLDAICHRHIGATVISTDRWTVVPGSVRRDAVQAAAEGTVDGPMADLLDLAQEVTVEDVTIPEGAVLMATAEAPTLLVRRAHRGVDTLTKPPAWDYTPILPEPVTGQYRGGRTFPASLDLAGVNLPVTLVAETARMAMGPRIDLRNSDSGWRPFGPAPRLVVLRGNEVSTREAALALTVQPRGLHAPVVLTGADDPIEDPSYNLAVLPGTTVLRADPEADQDTLAALWSQAVSEAGEGRHLIVTSGFPIVDLPDPAKAVTDATLRARTTLTVLERPEGEWVTPVRETTLALNFPARQGASGPERRLPKDLRPFTLTIGPDWAGQAPPAPVNTDGAHLSLRPAYDASRIQPPASAPLRRPGRWNTLTPNPYTMKDLGLTSMEASIYRPNGLRLDVVGDKAPVTRSNQPAIVLTKRLVVITPSAVDTTTWDQPSHEAQCPSPLRVSAQNLAALLLAANPHRPHLFGWWGEAAAPVDWAEKCALAAPRETFERIPEGADAVLVLPDRPVPYFDGFHPGDAILTAEQRAGDGLTIVLAPHMENVPAATLDRADRFEIDSIGRWFTLTTSRYTATGVAADASGLRRDEA